MRGLSDASGNVVDTYCYDAYGMLLDKTGSTINPYRYRGEQYDPELSAYYLRARYYQPGIGRFLTTDAVEGFPTDPMSLHRYLYGNANPVNNLDPSGKINLADIMTSVAIISNLTASSLGYVATVNDDFADQLAGYLPDAGLIGFSGFIGLKEIRMIKRFLAATRFGTIASILELDYAARGGGVGGIDLVFSIPSGEFGFYAYGGVQGDFGLYQNPVSRWGFTFYHGWVWNLWNELYRPFF